MFVSAPGISHVPLEKTISWGQEFLLGPPATEPPALGEWLPGEVLQVDEADSFVQFRMG